MVTKFDPKLVFDVGMHKGEDVDFYLQKGYNVVAFEADPDYASNCRTRFSNEISEGRLTIVEGAIVEESITLEDVTFYKNDKVSVWGTTKLDWKVRNELYGATSTSIKVKPVNFKNKLTEFGIPYYCKIDVEGADLLCLEALSEFDQHPKFVSIESDYTSIKALLREFKELRKLGFTKFAVVQQAGIGNRQARKYEREGIPIEFKFENGASGSFGDDLDTEWTGQFVALLKYSKIIILDKLLGDRSDTLRSTKVKKIKKWYEGHFSPLGWYDLHAR